MVTLRGFGFSVFVVYIHHLLSRSQPSKRLAQFLLVYHISFFEEMQVFSSYCFTWLNGHPEYPNNTACGVIVHVEGIPVYH